MLLTLASKLNYFSTFNELPDNSFLTDEFNKCVDTFDILTPIFTQQIKNLFKEFVICVVLSCTHKEEYTFNSVLNKYEDYVRTERYKSISLDHFYPKSPFAHWNLEIYPPIERVKSYYNSKYNWIKFKSSKLNVLCHKIRRIYYMYLNEIVILQIKCQVIVDKNIVLLNEYLSLKWRPMNELLICNALKGYNFDDKINFTLYKSLTRFNSRHFENIFGLEYYECLFKLKSEQLSTFVVNETTTLLLMNPFYKIPLKNAGRLVRCAKSGLKESFIIYKYSV